MFQPRLAFQPPEDQRAWQSQAFIRLLNYLDLYSPFYQNLFRKNNIAIATINGIQDLQHLPTTSKSDMQAHNPDFLCVPRTAIKEYTTTSGTLGLPVTIALTEKDLHRLAYNEHQSFLCADGKPEDLYQLMLTLDRQFMAGMAYYSGIRQLGAALVRTGPGLPSLQWDTINRLATNSLVAVPSFLPVMIAWAKEHGIDLQKTSVEKAVCIGESLRRPDFGLNTLAENIAKDWPLKLYSTYAATEMQTAFTECSAGKGGHQQPDLIIIEILDDAGNPLPDGDPGEVVITTLGIEGMPLLRYRTGDICSLYNEPCACGRQSKRLGPVLGRKQQMIKYKGTTLYPPAIFDILNELSYLQDYVVEVFTDDLGTDDLRLHLYPTIPADECASRLKPLLQSRLRVSPMLHFHSASDLQALQFPAGSRKQVRFIDSRNFINSR